jgi:hypothetical protein
VYCEQDVCFGQSNPRGRAGGVEVHYVLIGLVGPADIFLREASGLALEETAISLEVADLLAKANCTYAGRRPGLYRLNNACGNLILNRKDVRGIPVVALRPKLVVALDIRQLRGDPQPAARRPNTAFKDVGQGARS